MWSLKLWRGESRVKLEALKHEEICRFHKIFTDFSERLIVPMSIPNLVNRVARKSVHTVLNLFAVQSISKLLMIASPLF
jgi:hypothetical protein